MSLTSRPEVALMSTSGVGELVQRLAWLALSGVVLLWPAHAAAQSSIAGAVRDTSGAVLPGVTVEAASPALIEKIRTAVTDGQGRYSIVELRPGIYTLTFALPGFQTVRRQGIEVVANTTVPINVDMQVGAVEETVTVSGETPVVDVQRAGERQVLSRDLLDALPTARSYTTAGVIVPGIRLTGPTTGGLKTNAVFDSYLTVHGRSNSENS